MTLSLTPGALAYRPLEKPINQYKHIEFSKNEKQQHQTGAENFEKVIFSSFLEAIVPKDDGLFDQGPGGGIYRGIFIDALKDTGMSKCMGLQKIIIDQLSQKKKDA